jgi:DNA-binding CsgD family transcriptional regulator
MSPLSGRRTPPPFGSLDEIVASAPAFVFFLDRAGRYLYANRHFGSGSAVEEGKLLEEVLKPAQAAELRALMKRVESSGKPHSVEFAGADAIGRPRVYHVTLGPFFALGRVEGYVGVGVLAAASEEGRPTDSGAAALASRLTPKQREILIHVAEGLSSREIGRRLGVSERTVETHREQLMDRLDIRGVAALARFAMSAGLL